MLTRTNAVTVRLILPRPKKSHNFRKSLIIDKKIIIIMKKIFNMINKIYIKYRYRLYHHINTLDWLWQWPLWAIYTKGKYEQVNFKRTISSVYLNQFLKTAWGLEPQRNSLQSEMLCNSVALFVQKLGAKMLRLCILF